MTGFIIFGAVFGATFSFWFNVWALIPTTFVAVGWVVLKGVERGDDIIWLTLTATATVFALQVGYLLGVCSLHRFSVGRQRGSQAPSRAKAVGHSSDKWGQLAGGDC